MGNHEYQKVFIITPAHNEEKNIGEVLKELAFLFKNIIVVDDGSTDNTAIKAREVSSGITVIKHEKNSGKGAALKSGCEEAIARDGEILAFIDSDGQHLVRDLKKIVDFLLEKNLDIVFGVRKFNNHMPLMMKIGNRFLTLLINMLSNVKLADTQCGMRAMTAQAYEKIRWQETNYSVETEIIKNASQQNLKYGTVLIETIYKDKYKGTNIVDGVLIFFNLLKWKLKHFKN